MCKKDNEKKEDEFVSDPDPQSVEEALPEAKMPSQIYGNSLPTLEVLKRWMMIPKNTVKDLQSQAQRRRFPMQASAGAMDHGR